MGLSSLYPSIPPALNLDFANTTALDPRITFTRSSTGTYYDGKTVAVAEQNLLLNSQTITSSPWSSSMVRTTNVTTAPDGTNTGASIIAPASSGNWSINQGMTPISGSTYTISVYVKAFGYTNFLIAETNQGRAQCSFDLYAVTYNLVLGTSASITSVGNGWYRCTVTFVAGPGIAPVFVGYPSTGATLSPYFATYTGDGTSGVYIWGAQLEQRASVTNYTPTTTATITNYIPILQTAAIDSPRFNFNPITGESLGLLLEQNSTNLITYNIDFSNNWQTGTGAVSVTTAATIAPDGTQTAQKIIPDTTGGQHVLTRGGILSSGLTYTTTIYAKAAEYSSFLMQHDSGGNALFSLLGNGSASASSTNIVSIAPVGNGWFRCSNTVTTTGAASIRLYVTTSTGQTSFAGNGYGGIFFWGAQLEQLGFATSYIPAPGVSQVTRLKDLVSITGTNFSSWFNQSQGTFYYDTVVINPSMTIPLTMSNPTGSSKYWGYLGGGSTMNNGSTSYQTTTPSVTANTQYKCANSYVQGGVLSATVNGNYLNNIAIPANFNYTTLYFWDSNGAQYPTIHFKKLVYYPIALTTSQLQTLTGS